MSEDDFRRLIDYWQTQGSRPSLHLADDAQIKEWEAKHNVLLPRDLKQYVMRVNGIHGGDALEFGNDLFSFLPLSAMYPESIERADGRSGMFVFVDYLISSYWYCVELDHQNRETTRVFLGGGKDRESNRLVASSLKEFFELYREEPRALEF